MLGLNIKNIIILVLIIFSFIFHSSVFIPIDMSHHQPKNSEVRAETQYTTSFNSQMLSANRIDQDNWTMFRYNASHNGFINGVKAPETNNTLWTFNTTNSGTGNGVYSSAAIVNGKVYIGSGECNLYCLDLKNGTEYWNYSTGWYHGQSSSPSVANGKVFIGNDYRPYLWCINATSGNKIWEFDTGGGGMKGTYSSPTVVGDRVYFGDENKKVFCLPQNDPNSNGLIEVSEIIWQFTAPDPVWSSPTVVENRVYFGTGKGAELNANRLYCLYANNGTIDWTYPKSGNYNDVVTTPAVEDGKVYFGCLDKKVTALYANNGTKIWDFTTGDKVLSSPAVAYNRVYIGSDDNKFYCLNATTGVLIWNYTTDGKIWSSPTAADNKVYIGSCDGKIYCFNAISDSVQKFWEYKITSKLYGICSSPTIIDGKLVIGGASGGKAPDQSKIYCFADNDFTPPTVLDTYPFAQATNIPTTASITINFSEPMRVFTITKTNIFLTNGSAMKVNGTLNYNTTTNSVTFTPDSILTRGETYTITVLSEVRDNSALGLDGNKNGVSEGSPFDDYISKFTTSENIPPLLTNADITPKDGKLNIDFRFTIVYTDLDNDTPLISPAFIRVHLDSDTLGFGMAVDPSAPLYWRDGNYTNGERYSYTTQFPNYGQHTCQFKCADGIDTNSTQIFPTPLVWYPQELDEIPTQNAIEDIDLVVDLRDNIYDEDTTRNKLVISENSSYAIVDELNITFNYPNSFNYPNGKVYEMVQINISDPIMEYNITQDLLVKVIPVNDPPQISGIPNQQTVEGIELVIDVTPFILDEDNDLSELEISTNSSYANVKGKEITFLYPPNSEIIKDLVRITVSDGEFYNYQNITVTVMVDGAPFLLFPIPAQNTVEDTDLIIDLKEFIELFGISFDELDIEINSSYGTVQKTTLIFNYPNSFNYPSSQAFEFIQVDVSYQNYTDNQSLKINVQPENDAPILSEVKTPALALENTTIDLQVKYLDIDGSETPLVEVIINNKTYLMKFESGEIHLEGGIYSLELKLPEGNYSYYYRTNDLENALNSIYITETYNLSVKKSIEPNKDSDGDLIPDAWELQYILNPFDPTDAVEDLDEDNYTNLQEYLGVDGKPGGNDSSNPRDALDIPVHHQIEDGSNDDPPSGRDEESSIFMWMAIDITIFIIIVILILFLFLRHRNHKGGKTKDTDSGVTDARISPKSVELPMNNERAQTTASVQENRPPSPKLTPANQLKQSEAEQRSEFNVELEKKRSI